MFLTSILLAAAITVKADVPRVTPAELKALNVNRERAGTYVEEKDLRDCPVCFILLVVSLGCEWSARRRGGLA